jgi:hypothetical protein
MKTLLRMLLLLLGAVVILCAMLVLFGVSDKPDLALAWTLTHDDIARAKKILHEGSKTKPDEIGIIELTQPDLNLAANYLLNRYSKSAVKIELKNNMLRFTVTTTLPISSGLVLEPSCRIFLALAMSSRVSVQPTAMSGLSLTPKKTISAHKVISAHTDNKNSCNNVFIKTA